MKIKGVVFGYRADSAATHRGLRLDRGFEFDRAPTQKIAVPWTAQNTDLIPDGVLTKLSSALARNPSYRGSRTRDLPSSLTANAAKQLWPPELCVRHAL